MRLVMQLLHQMPVRYTTNYLMSKFYSLVIYLFFLSFKVGADNLEEPEEGEAVLIVSTPFTL
jgi:hypothetical protein